MLAAVVVIPEVPVTRVSLALSYALGPMGILTPYATGSAPLHYGSGYIGHRDFWLLGLGFGALYLVVLLGAGAAVPGPAPRLTPAGGPSV